MKYLINLTLLVLLSSAIFTFQSCKSCCKISDKEQFKLDSIAVYNGLFNPDGKYQFKGGEDTFRYWTVSDLIRMNERLKVETSINTDIIQAPQKNRSIQIQLEDSLYTVTEASIALKQIIHKRTSIKIQSRNTNSHNLSCSEAQDSLLNYSMISSVFTNCDLNCNGSQEERRQSILNCQKQLVEIGLCEEIAFWEGQGAFIQVNDLTKKYPFMSGSISTPKGKIIPGTKFDDFSLKFDGMKNPDLKDGMYIKHLELSNNGGEILTLDVPFIIKRM